MVAVKGGPGAAEFFSEKKSETLPVIHASPALREVIIDLLLLGGELRDVGDEHLRPHHVRDLLH